MALVGCLPNFWHETLEILVDTTWYYRTLGNQLLWWLSRYCRHSCVSTLVNSVDSPAVPMMTRTLNTSPPITAPSGSARMSVPFTYLLSDISDISVLLYDYSLLYMNPVPFQILDPIHSCAISKHSMGSMHSLDLERMQISIHSDEPTPILEGWKMAILSAASGGGIRR